MKRATFQNLLLVLFVLAARPLYGQVYPNTGSYTPAVNQIPFFTQTTPTYEIGSSSYLVYDPTTGNITVSGVSYGDGNLNFTTSGEQINMAGAFSSINLQGDYSGLSISGDNSGIYYSGSYPLLYMAGYSAAIEFPGDYASIDFMGPDQMIDMAGSNPLLLLESSGSNLSLTGDNSYLNISGDNSQILFSGTGNQINMSGSSPQLNFTGASPEITMSGAAPVLALSSSNSQLNLPGDNSSMTISGNSSTLNLSGSGIQINMPGSGSQLNLSGSGGQINMSGSYSQLNLSGSNAQINLTGTSSGISSGSQLYNYGGDLYWGTTNISYGSCFLSDISGSLSLPPQQTVYNLPGVLNPGVSGSDLFIGSSGAWEPIAWNAYNAVTGFQVYANSAPAGQIQYSDGMYFQFSNNAPISGANVNWITGLTLYQSGNADFGATGNPSIVTIYGELLTYSNTLGAYQFKVSDSGDIWGRTLELDLNTIAPDYVFAKDYKLMPLDTLQAYLAANSHLPEISSAAELEKKGKVNVGDMQMELLKKQEEMTLYIIDMNKKMEALEAQNMELQKQINSLKNK